MRDVAPPSGQQPPPEVLLGDGRTVELRPVAAAASDRHLADHPELIDRYGPHTRAWCVHDLQWLLLWAAQDADGQGVDFAAQLDWLVRVLGARDYPLDSLADALDTLAEEVAALPGTADRLRAGAARVRG
jgi:hypothetical protein